MESVEGVIATNRIVVDFVTAGGFEVRLQHVSPAILVWSVIATSHTATNDNYHFLVFLSSVGGVLSIVNGEYSDESSKKAQLTQIFIAPPNCPLANLVFFSLHVCFVYYLEPLSLFIFISLRET